MRILITSGGTIVPIDPVRSIRNSSTGRFGTELATAALEAGLEVIYLASTDSKSPFSYQVDYHLDADFEHHVDFLKKINAFTQKFHNKYIEYRYQSFAEYQELLKKLTINERPDIVMLVAAVSDYLVSHYSDTKVRSHEQLSIQLEPAPKLIHFIKTWLPETFLVGFKLLVDASDDALYQAAMLSIQQNHADLIVANDLSSIQRGKHEILLVEKNGHFQKHTDNLAETVIKNCLERSTS
jgi:phosphopantothenate--cysteine ligase